MTEKVRISDGEIKGGFTDENKTQKYQINYMTKVFENEVLKYDDKIELAILTPGNEPDKVFYHSLRFTSPDQLKVVILKLINAYAYFLHERGKLNHMNATTLPHMWRQEIEAEFHKLLKDKQVTL